MGLTPKPAKAPPRRYSELEQSAEYSYVAQEEDPEPLSSAPVKVPPDVLEGLERIRQSGKINMRNRIGVEMLAYGMGLFHAVMCHTPYSASEILDLSGYCSPYSRS